MVIQSDFPVLRDWAELKALEEGLDRIPTLEDWRDGVVVRRLNKETEEKLREFMRAKVESGELPTKLPVWMDGIIEHELFIQGRKKRKDPQVMLAIGITYGVLFGKFGEEVEALLDG